MMRKALMHQPNSNTQAPEVPPSSSAPKHDAAKEEDPMKKELDTKTREIIDLKVCERLPPFHQQSLANSLPATDESLSFRQDRYLRSVADFRNLQDRSKRDIAQARQFAISRFASDLIESVDNLDRALGTVDPAFLPPSSSEPIAAEFSNGDDSKEDGMKELNNLYQGLVMTERILMQTLKKHGLERFDPAEKAEKFDPNLHEAAFMTKMEGKEDGSVFSTMQKGFILNGRVVRAAKVGVVKNS
ncbi:uncharacterized protein KY384_004386 [Bacidia gigantensis]|uniref:uncharacterized protein n=1 Tax=Bacidia gigantensis TaxID=2732470 RepID=UPI001D045D74|nr:uncharacterized protein KY384_004386 [Bacidia gigantensis]KAG8531029.1 hypothetical protein KY384_004386 [Bacidia gigantensis]